MYKRHASLLLTVTIAAMVISSITPVGVLADDTTPPTEEPAVVETPIPVDPAATPEAELPDTTEMTFVPSSVEGSGDIALGNMSIWCPAGSAPIPGKDGCTAVFVSVDSLMDYLAESGIASEQGDVYLQDQPSGEAEADIPTPPTSTDEADSSTQAFPQPLDQESQGMEVVILDEQGQVVSATSPEGMDALLTGQPIWCPDGIAPDAGGDYCTGSFGDLSTLINAVSGVASSGVIYIHTAAAEVINVSELPSAEVADDMAQAGILGIGAAVSVPLESDVTLPEDVGATSPAPAGALEQDTGIVILNQQGEEVTLVSADNVGQEVVRDPIWCPDGVVPNPGNNGCTNSYASLEGLVTFLTTTQPAQNGTIWIEQGADASFAPIVIDGGVATTWANYALTLQGGWGGVSGNSDIVGVTTFSQSISIAGWKNNVTLNDLIVQNTSGNGIDVSTQGNIVLDGVSSNGNSGAGAFLENCSAVHDTTDPDPGNWYWYCTGPETTSISISDGTFNNNGSPAAGADGVEINTNGNIYLANVTANSNNTDTINYVGGIGMDAFTSSGSVYTTGVNNFNNNDFIGAGFLIGGSGTSQFQNLNASGNDWDGVSIYSISSGDISVTGTNLFTDEYGDGLKIFSNGNIYAANLTTNNTGGIHLETSNGSVTLTGVNSFTNTIYQGHVVFIQAGKNVYVDGVTEMNGPNGDGIKIGAGGSVVVSCSSSMNNSEYGLEVGFDDWVTGAPIYYPTSLTINNVSLFNNKLGDYLVNGGNTAVNLNPSFPCVVAANETLNDKISAEPVSLPGLNLVKVKGDGTDAPVFLDCSLYSGTMLVLSDGTFVNYACPTFGMADILRIGDKDGNLPGAIPDEATFVSGLSLSLKDGILAKTITDGVVTISFSVPEDLLNANLGILYWDGKEWIDLSTAIFTDGRVVFNGGILTNDGHFEARTNFTGVFVLVKK